MKAIRHYLVMDVSICLIFTFALCLCAFVEAQDVGDLAEFKPLALIETIEKEENLDILETIPLIEDENIEVEQKLKFFDVPLEEYLQTYIFELSEEIGIDPAIVIAIIEKESNYDASAVGDHGRSLGLMQIQFRWHTARMAELGCDNLLDARQNVCVGIDILADLLEEGESIEWVLMAYNGGHAYADRLAKDGEVSEYAAEVLKMAEELERR